MEIASGLVKLKPGSKGQVEKWEKTISSRLDEAVQTLKDEGVQIESWFKVDIEGHHYLLWYMRAESIERVFEIAQTLKHPIDKFHYELMAQIMDTNGSITAEPILDISADMEQ